MAGQTNVKCGVSEMPVVGLGTWQSKPGVVGAAVEHALKSGYRHIDCAQVYGNEAEIGEVFNKVFSGPDAIERKDVFITSKLWNTFHCAENVEAACDKTLKDLQLAYLDLYLIHWPMCLEKQGDNLFPQGADGKMMYDTKNPKFAETWGAMEKLVESGKCKNIGLSNFNIEQITEVMSEAKVQPACLQVESHPLLPNNDLLDFCKEKNIAFVAYSPLANPGSTFAREDHPNLLTDESVVAIAKKHGVSTGRVLIRYQVDKGGVAIPKSVTPSRIEENLDVFGFQLDSADLEELHSLGKKRIAGKGFYRTCQVLHFADHPYYPFKEELDL